METAIIMEIHTQIYQINEKYKKIPQCMRGFFMLQLIYGKD